MRIMDSDLSAKYVDRWPLVAPPAQTADLSAQRGILTNGQNKAATRQPEDYEAVFCPAATAAGAAATAAAASAASATAASAASLAAAASPDYARTAAQAAV